jgi:chaperonin GroES
MIRPLKKYVLIEPIKEDNIDGGVYIPEDVNEKSAKGVVIDVDEKADFKKGDIVVFKKWSDQEVKHKGKEYAIVKLEDVIAVIND